MKKLRGIMAILAATALIFGTVACSDGGGNDNNNNKTPTDQSDPISGGGSGTSDPVSGGGGSEGGDEGGSTTVDPVTYKWSFNEDTFDATKFITVQNASGADKYGLAEDYEYASTPSGMVMTLKAAAGGADHYNLVDKTKTIGSSTVYYGTATVGCIEPNGDLVVLKNVQGPFTVKAYVQCNSSSNKTDRYGYIKIGDEEFADASYKASTTLPAEGQVLTATYASSDKVDVVIGCAKIMRIYDVVVETAAAQDQSSAETNAASMTLSSDKESAKVGEKVTWTLTANNMDVPSTVDVYVDGSGTPFITGAAVTDGKYEMTVKEAWLETDVDDDPIETTVKVFVKSGDVSSNKVTITFVPADNIPLYSDLTPVNLVSDGFTAEELNYLFAMSDAEMETLVAGRYTDAACTIPVTEGYEGDIYIKLNKTKEELKAMIDAAIAAATKYTVKFYINTTDTEPAYTVTDVVSGTPLTDAQLTAAKAALVKEDFTLAGLYTDKALTTEFVETDGITGDTSVYAKWNAVVYFSSFVASTAFSSADVTAASGGYSEITSTDGLVTMDRTKYQANDWSTADYDADTGKGYTYTARVKVNKSNGSSNKGALTISSVKVGSVLRIDGGNASTDVRTVAFTGTDTDSTKWEASTMGTIYVTATASTVVLTSETNEFCIYGIHVVDEKVETSVLTTVTTYTKPTVELSASSCVLNDEVTVTTTVPDAVTKTTYSDGKVVSSTTPVTETVTISGATVTDGKVDTSAAGTLTITASYTIGDTAYTSDAVTLTVSSGFAVSTETIANNEETLGLTATTVSSSNTDAATVAITDAGIVITSVAAGEATITFGDGTNEGTIDVTVGAGGDITATVNKYSSVTQWYVIGADTETAATFTNKAITLSKSSGIYLPVTYATGKKVKLTFTVDMASVNADTGSKICGGFAQDDTFADTKYATFASNKGISNGSKTWSNGGSSNGYANSTKMWTGNTAAVADVTFSVEYTIGQESSDGSDIVMTGTISDGTTSDSKTVKQKDMKWGGTAGTVQDSVVPYIYFGAGQTDSITVSNITLTVDGEAVNTSAN
jgi:hypothetical protein